MPRKIKKGRCPEDKPFAVMGLDGSPIACYATEREARKHAEKLYASDGGDDKDEGGLHRKTAIKRVRGIDYPPRDFAYVPNPADPASWKLLLTDAPGKIALEQLQRAAAAISPAGYRGNRLEIPPAAASSVKRRLLAEFRRLKVNEAEIPATVKEASDNNFMVWKDTEGRTRWFAVYSNNFRDEDKPPEIVSEKSHKSYVDLVDAGLVDYPELWLWHIPGTAWGKADWVAYSDGFAMASGYVFPGSEHIADNISKMGDLGVSHGMPNPLLVYDPRYDHTILFHVTTEISPLPEWAAANKLTGFVIVGKGDITMSLPKEKREFLHKSGLGEDVLDRIEANLANARQLAIDAGVESKEISDDEDDDEYFDDEMEDGDDDGEAEDGDEPVTEKAKRGMHTKPLGFGGRRKDEDDEKVNWNSGRSKRRKKPDDKVNWNSGRSKVNWNSSRGKEQGEDEDEDQEQEEEVTEKARGGMHTKPLGFGGRRKDEDDEKVNWNSGRSKRRKKPDEKVNWNSGRSKVNWNSSRGKEQSDGEEEYATRGEVAEAVSAIIAPIIEHLEVLTKEINDLRRDDEDRFANVKEMTPTLSLTDMIMSRNPIGKEATRVRGNTSLGKAAPVQVKSTSHQATMIPLINDLIEGMYSSQDES